MNYTACQNCTSVEKSWEQ